MDKKEIKKIIDKILPKIKFQVIKLDNKDYVVFNDKQFKEFIELQFETMWKSLPHILKKPKEPTK